jgi:RNA polymerase sigma-70 factor, ECF subfamily
MKLTTICEVSMSSAQQFAAANKQGSLISNGAVNDAVCASPQAIPQGYSAAFEQIWQAHARQILRVTQCITKNREDAEDALQDSFLRAYVHLHNFDGRSSIKTWLMRIAINSALMILRKRARGSQISIHEDTDSEGDSQWLTPVDSSPSPEAQYAELERQAIVRSAIAALRPAVRQALELQTLEDRSTSEIAERLGLSISATKSRIFHAKAALRKSLKPKIGRRAGGTKLQLSPA